MKPETSVQPEPPEGPAKAAGNSPFATTRWSLVLMAAQGRGEAAAEAMRELCVLYANPIRGWLRRQGTPPGKLEDTLNDCVAHLFKANRIGRVDGRRGRFRSYLLTGLRWYLIDRHREGLADMRNPPEPVEPLGGREGEIPGPIVPVDEVLDRSIALEIHRRVMESLRQRYRGRGLEARFDELLAWLPEGGGGDSYTRAAGRLGIREGTIRVAVHRCRAEYAELFRAEVAEITTPGDLVEELHYLIGLLLQGGSPAGT